ncbi:hypothetical protein [Aquirufa sp.]|jgi:hypothetical protein|uniref:hypothetical protein n=1 Tax=Aquirufa sp. TaxID=2676249 RepID=UPI003783FDC3
MSKFPFYESLTEPLPPAHFSVLLKSLWYDAKGDWKTAHDLVDSLAGEEAAWVHAYLHRKEGDSWNADYWYARAKKVRPSHTLEEEWESLVMHFMA